LRVVGWTRVASFTHQVQNARSSARIHDARSRRFRTALRRTRRLFAQRALSIPESL